MMVIAIALQVRILDAATRHFGSGGEEIVHQAAQNGLGSPFDAITYEQLPALFAIIDREAPLAVGRIHTNDLARALEDLSVWADASLGDRLTTAISTHLGPAASVFLRTTCAKLGISPTDIDRPHVPRLAEIVEHLAGEVLGPAVSHELADSIRTAGTAVPSDLPARIERLAVEHIGADGANTIRNLCRQRIEVDLEDLDWGGVSLLARVVRQDGEQIFGHHRAAAFLAAARRAVSDPGSTLRARLLEIAHRYVGPAAPVFITRVCARNGLPFDALGYEHLSWFVAKLQEYAAPLMGSQEAEAFTGAAKTLMTDSN